MWSVIRKGFRRHALMVAFAGAALVAGLGVIAPESAQAATLYISEFASPVGQVGSVQANVYPQPAITDQTVAITGASVQSAAFNASTHAIQVECDSDCSISIGTNPTATTTNYLMGDGIPYQFVVVPGQKIAVISNTSGGSGSDVNIVAVGGNAVTTSVPVSIIAGSAVIGHVITDTGSTTAVTQPTASNLNATVVGTGTFADQATLQAGENHAAEVGGNEILVQVAQTVTASSAYASGNAIGGLMTIANAARVSGSSGTSGTSGLLQSVMMNIKSAQTTPVDIFIFNANPTGTTCTDKSAIAIAAADFDKVLGVVHMTDFTSGGTPSDGQAQNLAMPYALTSATTLYACAVTRSTPTYAATSDVSFGFRFLRN